MDLWPSSLIGSLGPETLVTLPEALLAALVSAVATLGLIAGFGPRAGFGRGGGRSAETADGTTCEWVISGASLKALNEPARALLETLPAGGPRLAALAAHLAEACPDLRSDLESLVLYGTGFRHHCTRADGTAFEIVGEPRGGAAYLTIRPASEDARALKDAEAALVRASVELAFLRDIIDRSPVFAWSHGPDGQVTWANAAYRSRFDAPAGDLPDHRIANAFDHVLEEVPLTARGSDSRRRVLVPARDGDTPRWYEISRSPAPSGGTLGFAVDAGEIVAAEASLRRFIETLTETFAHLPIGLAVFDKNRRLGLFNPALSDLVKIDAVWLAGRPSLRDFLERLRETRQMPEQKDFASFRRKLTELEEGAREGTYEENWHLPSGKIFRVTGRPHPQGALAFLFEDISTTIQLERRYRSELELSQATLDRLSEAVAVFDASGTIVFVNQAFATLWGFDPMERLEGPAVAEMTALWAQRCLPSPVWADLAEFTTAAEARAAWTATVTTRAGADLHVLVAPLPDASALVVFRDLTAEAAERDTSQPDLGDLAFEQLRLPVEGAVQRLLSAIPVAASPEAFQALGNAAQSLRDGLARAAEIRALGGGPAVPGPLPELATALASRGLALAAPPEAAGWPADRRRVALALGLAASEIVTPGGTVTLALAADGRRLTASVPGRPRRSQPDGVGLALARRVLEAGGGSLEVKVAGETTSLVANLPPACAAAVAEALPTARSA